MKPVWTDNIPLDQLKVGDNVRATVICRSKPPSWSNRTHKTVERNGKVTEIIGNIVRIDCSRTKYAILRADIHKAWGYR